MKIWNFKWRMGFIFVVAAIGVIACSPKTQQMKGSGLAQLPPGPRLTKIEVVDLPNSTQILLEGENALQYTSFTLSDPPRLIIDLSGISAGKFKEPIEVNKGAVKEIDPVETDLPTKVTRLDIRLLDGSKGYRVNRREKTLVVELPKMTEISSKAPDTSPSITPSLTPQPMETKAEIMSRPAENGGKRVEKQGELNIVREIKATPSDDKTNIVISADKDIDAEAFLVEGKQLVIDINNANHALSKEEIPIEGSKVISRLRIGRHITPTRKVRIVADLNGEVTYDMSKGGKVFTVSILPKIAGRAPEKMVSENRALSTKEPESPPVTAEKVTPKRPIPAKYSGKKVSLDFQDADITNVLRLLAEVSKLNMVIGDNVTGKITVKMLDVPWDQALDIILKMKGLGKVSEDNVLRIGTLTNIAQQQEEEAKAKESMVKAEDLVTKILPVNYAKAKDIAESLKKSLSVRGDITIDSRTNTLIVKDIKDKQEEIDKLLKTLDRPTPQVLIEARIVQADSNFARDLGIEWGGSYATTPGNWNIGIIGAPDGSPVGAPALSGFAVNLPASGVAGTKGSMGFSIGKTVGDAINLDLRLSAGETKGLTKVLSAPKIATLDNTEATIQQGEAIPYKTVSQTGTKTEFIDATLTLKVTPKVTPDGHIAMNIKISKNRQGSIVVEGTPSINKKEATTEVLVKDGETTVIGGIYEMTDVDNLMGVPWFYQVPLLGWLFKSTEQSNIKSELLIFITPKIIPVTT